MAVERGGDRIATVKKAMIAPLRDRFTIEAGGRVANGDRLGSILNAIPEWCGVGRRVLKRDAFWDL
jgi:hypothetical protein